LEVGVDTVEAVEVVSYRDLRVWQDAMALAEASFLLIRSFPNEELFGMSAQIRRAAASIPANIAEGNGREQTRTYIQFLRIAQGSLKELEILLSERLQLAGSARVREMLSDCDALGRMLRALIRSLQRREAES
jgi:four helix bundle protein